MSPAGWTYVGPACRAGLRGPAATCDLAGCHIQKQPAGSFGLARFSLGFGYPSVRLAAKVHSGRMDLLLKTCWTTTGFLEQMS